MDAARIEVLLEEYEVYFGAREGRRRHSAYPKDSWGHIEETLRKEGGWTEEGAGQIVCLARQYGVFMLRNALAVAIALDVEDGDLGY